MALSGLGVVLGRVASEGLGVPVPAEVPERPQCLSYEYVTQLPQAAASRPDAFADRWARHACDLGQSVDKNGARASA